MKIEIIKIDDLGVLDEAWRISRPGEDTSDIDKILSIDAPINDIPCAVLHITSTIGEREVFASARDHVMWAKTSRVSDPTEWGMEMNHSLQDLHAEQLAMKSSGVSQDIYRMHMPLGAITEYTIRISIRSLVKLSDYFKYIGIDNSALESVISNWISDANRPVYKLTKFMSKITAPGNGIVGDFLVITVAATLALRAQAIRHKQFIVKDDLEEILTSGHWEEMPVKTEIKMQLCASVGFWKSIFEKRSCWMAQYGLWHPVMEHAQQYLPITENMLPCKDYCVFGKDAELRYTDKDPGSPCPKHIIINSRTITQQQRDDINKQFEFENRPQFWRRMIDEIK
jgi:hypothetical protein